MGERIGCRLFLKKLTVRKFWGLAAMCHGEGQLWIPEKASGSDRVIPALRPER